MVILLTKLQSDGHGDNSVGNSDDNHILQIAFYEL
jgi:hypothetical protein